MEKKCLNIIFILIVYGSNVRQICKLFAIIYFFTGNMILREELWDRIQRNMTVWGEDFTVGMRELNQFIEIYLNKNLYLIRDIPADHIRNVRNLVHRLQSNGRSVIIVVQFLAAQRALTLRVWLQFRNDIQLKIFIMKRQLLDGEIKFDKQARERIRSIFDSVDPNGKWTQSRPSGKPHEIQRIIYDIYDLEYAFPQRIQ